MEKELQRFQANTGVRPFDFNPPAGMAFMEGFEDSGNGVYVIPFYCYDVPKGAKFTFAADNPDLGKLSNKKVIVRKIYNSKLTSEFAYFELEDEKE